MLLDDATPDDLGQPGINISTVASGMKHVTRSIATRAGSCRSGKLKHGVRRISAFLEFWYRKVRSIVARVPVKRIRAQQMGLPLWRYANACIGPRSKPRRPFSQPVRHARESFPAASIVPLVTPPHRPHQLSGTHEPRRTSV